MQRRRAMGDLCSGYPLKKQDGSATSWHAQCHLMKAVWEMRLFMLIWMRKDSTDSMRSGWPLKGETGSDLKHQFFLQCKIEHEHHFQCRENCNEKSQSQNEYSWEYGNVMRMSVVAWFIPWMGKYFALRQNKIKTNIHVSWWQWQSWLKDIEESHWTSNSPSVSGEDL